MNSILPLPSTISILIAKTVSCIDESKHICSAIIRPLSNEERENKFYYRGSNLQKIIESWIMFLFLFYIFSFLVFIYQNKYFMA